MYVYAGRPAYAEELQESGSRAAHGDGLRGIKSDDVYSRVEYCTVLHSSKYIY